MMKKKKIDSLSNTELCNLIKDLAPGFPGRVDDYYNTHYVYLGAISPTESPASVIHNREVWDVIRPRIEEFLKRKNDIHRHYYNTPYFPWDDSISATIIGAIVSKNKRARGINVYAIMKTASSSWSTTERVSFEEFCDSNFDKNYSKALRDKRMKLCEAGIDRCLVKMGKYLEEQDKLKKEEGN